jgi:hypothetical protein
MPVISAILSLYEHMSQKMLPVSQNFLTGQCIVLFDASLSGYTLLNALQTAEMILMQSNI